MAKKFSLLLAALAVLAFAVPAFASAAPAVTDESGELLPPATAITGTSTNATTQTSLGKISCATVEVNGVLTENSGSLVEGEGTGEGNSETCFLGGTRPIEITDITLQSLFSNTPGSGTINVTFEADLPQEIVCHFESPGLPFTYTSGSDVLKITNGDLKATPAACEPGILNGEFTIEQTGVGPVVLD